MDFAKLIEHPGTKHHLLCVITHCLADLLEQALADLIKYQQQCSYTYVSSAEKVV